MTYKRKQTSLFKNILQNFNAIVYYILLKSGIGFFSTWLGSEEKNIHTWVISHKFPMYKYSINWHSKNETRWKQ